MKRWLRRFAPNARGVQSEAGDTLLEVLLALIVLSLASVALITAFQTSIKASAEHRSLANFNTALASSISNTSSVIEQQSPGVFSNCEPLTSYPSSAELTAALGLNGYTAAIASSGSQPAVEYSSKGSYTSSCSSSDVGNPQLINVVVTNTATGLTQSNTVVVDNPTVIQTTGAEGATANKLVFITQPEGATVNSPFATQPVLEVQDNNGVVVTSDLSPITLTVESGPAGATLSKSCSGEETAGIITYSGCSLDVVGTGYTLFASEPDPSGPGDLTKISDPFSVYPSQLVTPTVTAVIPSITTVGVVNVSYTGALNAPTGQTYSVKACQDSSMSVNCLVQNNFVSGNPITLVAGMNYWVSITAAASTNYLGSTSPPVGPTLATVQLLAPGLPTLGYGPTSGTLSVTFAGSSNAPNGETYTVLACTNSAMTTGCVTTNTSVPSGGGTITGLTPGTLYYVVVTANAATSYLVSPRSTISPAIPPSYAATNQVKTPVISNTTAPSPSQVGAILVTFSEPSGGAPVSSYTENVCTNSGMSQGCLLPATVTLPGGQVSSLNAGTNYYITITANSTTSGIASATSGAFGPVMATVQLTTPTNVAVNYGATAGSVSITAGSSNGPANQTYTAKGCTNAGMTQGCTTNATYTLGNDFIVDTNPGAGNAGVTYYVQITANASPGYLASTTSTQSSHADTGLIGVASNFNVTSPANGTIKVTFAAPTGSAPAPTSYTVEICASQNFPSCGTPQTNFVSGGQFTGLTRHQTYYVEIISVAPVGYVSNSEQGSARTN